MLAIGFDGPMTQPKSKYAADLQNTANDTAMSLALRQMQKIFSGPTYWIIIGSVILLTAMAGPYFTLERLSFPERLVFWGATTLSSSVLMTFLSILVYRWTYVRNWHWSLGSLLAAALGVVPVVCSIFLAEGLATGFAPGWQTFGTFGSLTLYVAPSLLAVTLGVNMLLEYWHPQSDPAEPPQLGGRVLTLLDGKLPRHLGRDIISVQAHDHYVEVATPKGRAMVLMRLSDAVQALEPLDGLRVHRSWWINLSHVVRTEKGANGPELVLTSDQRIPVGRSFRAAYREAMAER